ncbi:tetratricopeptide repeat protein [bacterium]|nr:tetratricopeptide repeat protein [bacterium]
MQITDTTESATNLAGLKIKERYVLLEEIGHGLMARAYLAYDELLEGEVVVKVINTEIGGVKIPLGPEWVQEAKRAMKVRGCPYIASVTDFGEENCEIDGEKVFVPFIVWERVYGKTLQEYIEEKQPIDGRMIIVTIIQLLHVLIALKRNNLIHGDLHVKNVMYDDVSTSRHLMKVIDFGLANLISSEADFKRDRKSVGKVLWQIIDAFKEQERSDDDNVSLFLSDVGNLADEIAAPHPPTLDELNDLLVKAEELERKFFLGVEWFQSRGKDQPAGQDVVQYLKNFKNSNDIVLVGADEIDELKRWLKNGLDEGLGRILALKADTGLGKSRWSLELLQQIAADESDICIMRTTAYPGDKNRPFETTKRLWRSYLGDSEVEHYKNFLTDMFPEIPLLVSPLVALITPNVGDVKEPTQMMDEINYQKLIATGFKHLSLKHKLIICIDDVNYVDSQSLQLLRDISIATAKYPVMIVVTFNMANEGDMSSLMEEFSRRANYLLYEIRDLDLSQTHELLLSKYSWEYPEDAHRLAEMLHATMGGNPFYLVEMLKSLENQKQIIRDGGSVRLSSDIDVQDNPRSVQSLMLERMEMLPDNMQDALKWASILGNEFIIDNLAALSGSSSASVEKVVKSLADEHHVFVRTDDTYTFNPNMLCKVVYSSIPDDVKREKHIAAAEVLRSNIHHDQKLAAKIAEHLEKAGQTADVAEYYLKAARYAQKINLKSQAEEWCECGMKALENKTGKDEHLLGRFYLLKGALARQSGDADSYRENTYSAYNRAILSRDTHLEGQALKALGEYYRSIADYRSSIDYFKNGLDVLKETGDDREVALILKELSINFCFQGDFDKAIDVLGKSREICETLNDREGMARIYNNMGLIYKILGDIPLAKEWLERSIRLFREIDDIQGEVLPIGNMAIIYTEEGEFERAMILLREIISSQARLADTRVQAKVHVTMADVLFELGEYRESMDYYERALMVFRALGDRQGECETLTNIAFAQMEQGKYKLAENYSLLAYEIKKDIGYERGIPFNYLINAKLASRLGDLEKAEENIKKGLESPTVQAGSWLKLAFMLEHALVLAQRGDIDSAKPLYTQIENAINEKSDKSPRTFIVLFYYRYGVFLNEHGEEDSGNKHIAKSKEVLGTLERKIFQMKWREKFRHKYDMLLSADNTSAHV